MGALDSKGKTSLGDIQDNAAVVRVEIDIGGSVHCHPWTVASFRLHGRYSPCHPRLKIALLSCAGTVQWHTQTLLGLESGKCCWDYIFRQSVPRFVNPRVALVKGNIYLGRWC